MSNFWKTWRTIISCFSSRRSRSILKRRTQEVFRPELELLEERTLLSTTSPIALGASVLAANGISSAKVPIGMQPFLLTLDANQSATQTVYTPTQIASYYGFNRIFYPTLLGIVPGNGAGQTIALVEAGYDPWLVSDLSVFDITYGIPAPPLLAQIGENGGPPDTSNWDPTGMCTAETSLDVEWAHALAPGANIVVVGAGTLFVGDMFTAVNTAASIPGVSVVSMSWGSNGDIYPGVLSLLTPLGINPDAIFAAHPNVTFVAASGDTAGQVSYPSTSPYVLAVGGTVLQNDQEIGWTNKNGPSPGALHGSGGGWTLFETEPDWQYWVQDSGQRSTPDVSAIGGSFLSVYDSYPILNRKPGGWMTLYGTSASAPQWAALIAIADEGRRINHLSPIGEQAGNLLYSLPQLCFNPIDGTNSYNPVTGLGSPVAQKIVQGLGATLSDPPPAPPNNLTGQFQLLWSIPVEQFWAEVYDWLTLLDPHDYEMAAQSARLVLGSNPMLYTMAGRIIETFVVDSLGWPLDAFGGIK